MHVRTGGRGTRRGRPAPAALVLAFGLLAACQPHHDTATPPRTPARTDVPASPVRAEPGADPRLHGAKRRLLVVWTRGALPAGLAARVRRLHGIAAASPVVAGVVWMTRSSRPDGTAVERAPRGFLIPMDVAGANPSAYAAVLGRQAAGVGQVRQGGAVLGRVSADLHRLHSGDLVRLTTGSVQVAGVVPDAAIGAHEIFLSRRRAESLGIHTERYLVARLRPGVDPASVRALLRALISPTPVRIRSATQTPYLREADGVLPPVWEKVFFGQFAAHVEPQGALRIDPSWIASHIASAHVPILGTVRCNRNLIPTLRASLRYLQRSGLASLVRPSEYRGCFVPSLIPGSAEISHHTWGSALDVNVNANWLGQTPHQDPRLVGDFVRHGFVWGGRFLVPDGMHFEYGCPATFRIRESIPVPIEPPRVPLCRG